MDENIIGAVPFEPANGKGMNAGASIKQVAVLRLGDEAECRIGCQAVDIHPKDWVGLYKNASKGDSSYITWQYANECNYDEVTGQKFYNTGETFKDGYEVRYQKYYEGTGNYGCVARTGPLPRANDGIRFEYNYYDDNWMCLDHKDGKFVISYSIPKKQSYDWIGIYKDKDKDDTDYETYFWVVNSASPIKTSIYVQEGYQIRFFSGTGRWTYDPVVAAVPFPQLGVSSVAQGCPRSPTLKDKNKLLRYFPKLKDGFKITDEETWRYNCIAWSLGFTDRWILPAHPLLAFIEQYKNSGCEEYPLLSSSANIDCWAESWNHNETTHGSKKYDSSMWESKCGASFRITHGRTELESAKYGEIVASFGSPGFKLADSQNREIYMITQTETNKIQVAVAGVNIETKRRFDELYAIWQYSINGFPFVICSDTAEYKKADGFDKLVEMGVEIIPLVVEKLLDEDHFMANVLYDELQSADGMSISYHKNDRIEVLLEGEQSRAKRIVKKWIENAL
jgi:hypothetical protein